MNTHERLIKGGIQEIVASPGRQSLYHWATRDVLYSCLFF